MSKNTRTYVPTSSLSMMVNQTADDFIRARDGNILIGQEISPNISHSDAKHNIVIGHGAAKNLTNGDYNTFIGYGVGTTNESYKFRVGNRQYSSNDLMVGTFGTSTLNQDLTLNADVVITSVTQSNDKDTGCLILQGGLGVEMNTNIGGTLTVHDTTDSSSSTTGSTIIDGGLGVAKKVYVGSDVDTSSYSTGSLVVSGGVGVAKDLNAKDIYQTRTGADGLSVPYLLVPAGVIMQYVASTAPSGYLLCDGSAIARATYSVLFSVISTTFGSGNGSTTFNVPDLRGKVPTGVNGNEESAFTNLGNSGGSEEHTLSIDELPSHNHGGATGSDGDHDHDRELTTTSNGSHNHGGTTGDGGNASGSENVSSSDEGALVSGEGIHNHTIDDDGEHEHKVIIPSSGTHTHTISSQGGGNAHSILQPYLVVNYIIKY